VAFATRLLDASKKLLPGAGPASAVPASAADAAPLHRQIFIAPNKFTSPLYHSPEKIYVLTCIIKLRLNGVFTPSRILAKEHITGASFGITQLCTPWRKWGGRKTCRLSTIEGVSDSNTALRAKEPFHTMRYQYFEQIIEPVVYRKLVVIYEATKSPSGVGGLVSYHRMFCCGSAQ